MRRVGYPPDTAGTPLFDAAPWPQAPAAGDEPRVADLTDPIARDYLRWRRTPDGERFFDHIRLAALHHAAGGALRIEVNALWARARAELRIPANNDFRSLCARELRELHPILRDRIQVRRRTAKDEAA